MSEVVMADAQFTNARILRPYAKFDAPVGPGSYQGASPLTPIMFSEGGKALDALAGTTGYAPTLLSGLAVPFGARVQLWLPVATTTSGSPYEWSIYWRMRNVFDFRQTRTPFHYPKQVDGAPATLALPPPGFAADVGNRVIIPAANHVVVYNQGEPPDAPSPSVGVNKAKQERIAAFPGSFALPLLPSGNFGTFQQGVFDPAAFPLPPLSTAFAYAPMFDVFDVQATGDELLIGLTRKDTVPSVPWDFAPPLATGADFLLSVLFGTGSGKAIPDLGVYVMFGSAP
jgi:hypothetical protein